MSLLKRLWRRLSGRRMARVVDTGGGARLVTTLHQWETDDDLWDTHVWVMAMVADHGWTLVSHPPVVGR